MENGFEEFFNEENIEMVQKKIEEYMKFLQMQDICVENMKDRGRIFGFIHLKYDQEIMDLVIKYSKLRYEDTKYSNCLAYYLGFQNGLKEK